MGPCWAGREVSPKFLTRLSMIKKISYAHLQAMLGNSPNALAQTSLESLEDLVAGAEQLDSLYAISSYQFSKSHGKKLNNRIIITIANDFNRT